MKNTYLRAFVIGSSFLVFLPYFWAVSGFKKSKFNFDFTYYVFIAPPALGVMNMVSLLITDYFHLTNRMRYLIASVIAPTCILMLVKYFNIYNYTKEEWIQHIFYLYLLYFVVFNFIVYFLDKYI